MQNHADLGNHKIAWVVYIESFDDLLLQNFGKEKTVAKFERGEIRYRSHNLYLTSLKGSEVSHALLDEYPQVRPDIIRIKRGKGENLHPINLLPQHSKTSRAQR
jgi:hypothetical protein